VRWRPAVLAALAGVAGFLLATRGESLIIAAVHGDRSKLEWISDTVVSLFVVALTYLWLNLRESQMLWRPRPGAAGPKASTDGRTTVRCSSLPWRQA
jgi:hypothetical protein